MNVQDDTDFKRIASAIDFINTNFSAQPDLEELARHVHLSPFHFQRLFSEWAGVSPKKFLQYLTLNHAKRMLREEQATLFNTAFQTGLSGTGRLHDLFVNIEGMTPAEYKNGGACLFINYSYAATPFGKILLASTAKGICYAAFVEEEEVGFEPLYAKYPNAIFQELVTETHLQVQQVFKQNQTVTPPLSLHIKGTDFQLKVWEALLKIPSGCLISYGKLADSLGLPSASRAVGTAVGANPVAVLIPCHRVIQSTGIFGQYHWGSSRKQAIIGWEAAAADKLKEGN